MMKRSRLVSWFLLFLLLFSLDSKISFSDQNNVDDPSSFHQEDALPNYGAGPSDSAQQIQASSKTTGGVSDRITLELKGVNVLDVLKIIAKRSGMNIVAGRDVRGDVTLYMQDVEVRRALDTIVQTLGLAYDEKDGIITVMSNKEFVSRYGKPFKDERVTEIFKLQYANPQTMSQLVQQMKSPAGKIAIDEKTATIIATDLQEVINEIHRTVQEFDQPLFTKTFILKYAKAADVGDEIKDYLTTNVGILKIDKRSNRISVTDRKAIVEHVSGIVESFDARPLQVLIEAKVVEVQLYDAFRYGIDWTYVGIKIASTRNFTISPAQTISAPSSTLGGGTLSTFTLGVSGKDKFQSVLNILQNIGKTNILSSPRLMCLNNEEAKLSVATKQPYNEGTTTLSTTAGQTSNTIKFIDVGVTLSIVPTISDDGNVVLKVKPEVSTNGGTFTVQCVAQGSNTAFDCTKVPIVTSQTLETTVIAKDDTTVVVGGLIQDKTAKIRKKFPVLGDIPWLGAAFRTESNDFNKTELVVFLTPHIISGKTDSLEERKYLDKNTSDFIDFNKVGGHDFLKGETSSSQGFLRMNDKPYYESPVKERPVYFPSKDSGIRALPYRGNVNAYADESVSTSDKKSEKKQEKAQAAPASPESVKAHEEPVLEDNAYISPAHHARRQYREMVQSAVSDALKLRHDLGDYPISVELFLIIEKDGKLTLKRLVKDHGLNPAGRSLVIETLGKLSPFPPFPPEMKSDQELLDLKVELT